MMRTVRDEARNRGADIQVIEFSPAVELILKVCFLHTVQYRPTGFVFPEQAEGILITDKFRGSGANLVNIEGNQLYIAIFMQSGRLTRLLYYFPDRWKLRAGISVMILK